MNFFRKLMSGVMPSCLEASRLASRSLDEKLPISRRLALWLHQRMCGLCRRYGSQLNFMRDAASKSEEKMPAPSDDARLSDAARDRLKEKLRSATKESE
ncbi:MAG: hypothetical protein ACI8QF_002814 [Limisphaerales bacterium]|jgi:hypothetical protein